MAGAFAAFEFLRGVLGVIKRITTRYPQAALCLLAVWVVVKAAGG